MIQHTTGEAGMAKRAMPAHRTHLDCLPVCSLEDVSRPHASAIDHVLTRCGDDVHLRRDQPHLSFLSRRARPESGCDCFSTTDHTLVCHLKAAEHRIVAITNVIFLDVRGSTTLQ